mmetsp:Transcript_14856/g.52909  ORF Transcript_14856/g.52909 Transcript_14856/m.52909 type:complete len:453 (+) Transcript_14856:2216-3574(+)
MPACVTTYSELGRSPSSFRSAVDTVSSRDLPSRDRDSEKRGFASSAKALSWTATRLFESFEPKSAAAWLTSKTAEPRSLSFSTPPRSLARSLARLFLFEPRKTSAIESTTTRLMTGSIPVAVASRSRSAEASRAVDTRTPLPKRAGTTRLATAMAMARRVHDGPLRTMSTLDVLSRSSWSATMVCARLDLPTPAAPEHSLTVPGTRHAPRALSTAAHPNRPSRFSRFSRCSAAAAGACRPFFAVATAAAALSTGPGGAAAARYDAHVHVRSGDIFSVHDQTHYVPPPLSFYVDVIEAHRRGPRAWRRIKIIAEDDANPVVAALQERYGADFEPSTLDDDIAHVVGARRIIYGQGTFVPALLLFNTRAEETYGINYASVAPYLPSTAAAAVRTVDLQDYFRAMFPWAATRRQRARQLDWPRCHAAAADCEPATAAPRRRCRAQAQRAYCWKMD